MSWRVLTLIPYINVASRAATRNLAIYEWKSTCAWLQEFINSSWQRHSVQLALSTGGLTAGACFPLVNRLSNGPASSTRALFVHHSIRRSLDNVSSDAGGASSPT
jgi:hypothetical protein